MLEQNLDLIKSIGDLVKGLKFHGTKIKTNNCVHKQKNCTKNFQIRRKIWIVIQGMNVLFVLIIKYVPAKFILLTSFICCQRQTWKMISFLSPPKETNDFQVCLFQIIDKSRDWKSAQWFLSKVSHFLAERLSTILSNLALILFETLVLLHVERCALPFWKSPIFS